MLANMFQICNNRFRIDERMKQMIKYWTTFQGSPHGYSKEKIRITLSKKHTLLLNKKAHAALGSAAAVELLFDANRRLIGLKATDPTKKNAFPVKVKKNSNYHVISASSFCMHFGISVESTVVFNEPEMGKDGILVLKLADAFNVTRGVR